MTAVVEHIQEFGFNKFDHPRIADHISFVITPALDHFYAKAVVDVREGPAVVETAAKDDRYSSIQIFDMEHHTKFDKVTSKEGEKFVLVREDFEGELPEGTVIKVNITGGDGEVDFPDLKSTQAIVNWTYENEIPYGQSGPERPICF